MELTQLLLLLPSQWYHDHLATDETVHRLVHHRPQRQQLQHLP